MIRPDLTPEPAAGDLAEAVDGLVGRSADQGTTHAIVVVQGGETIVERYGTMPGNLFAPDPVEVGPDTPLLSGSIAKSIVHAAVGVLVGEGRLDVSAPAPIAEWRGTDKETITVLDLLEMRSGLRFVEDDADADHSDCTAMLFGAGRDDHAAYAAAQPLDHPIGSVWNYSSGSTNIVCRIIGDVVGHGLGGAEPAAREQRTREFLDDHLFGPAGMATAAPSFDPEGTWVGSSYVHATARDFARFGELYLRDGTVGGERLLPEGWVDHARVQVSVDAATGFGYGRHWWIWPDMPSSLAAHGDDGQYVIVVPERDSVVVHLGATDSAVRPQLVERLRRIIACL